MRRQGTCVGLGGTASPYISIEVAFIVNWTRVATATVGTDIVVALVVLVSIALRALRLRNDILASILALQQCLEVIVVALTSGIIEDLACSGHRVIPVSSDGLFAVTQSKRLGANGLWSRTADIVVTLAFMGARTVRISTASLIRGSDLQRSSVFALQFGTEQFAFCGRLEVVVVADGSIVGEGDAATLLGVVVISAGGGVGETEALFHRQSSIEVGRSHEISWSSASITAYTGYCWTTELHGSNGSTFEVRSTAGSRLAVADWFILILNSASQILRGTALAGVSTV